MIFSFSRHFKTIHQCQSCGTTLYQENGGLQAYIPVLIIYQERDDKADRIVTELIRVIGPYCTVITNEEFESYFNFCLTILGIEIPTTDEYNCLYNLVWNRIHRNVCPITNGTQT